MTQRTDFEAKSFRLPWLLVLGMLAFVYVSGGHDWSGWALVFASFVVVLGDQRVRADKTTLAVVLFVLLAHHGASIANVYFSSLPGARYDALTFHIYAVEHIYESKNLFQIRMGSEFYEFVLAYAYLLGGESLFLGQQLSILVFAFTCIVFVRLVDLLGLQRFTPWLVLLFGGLPSAVVFGSLTLREGYELFFFILGVYAGLRAFMAPAWWALPVCIGSLVTMGMFHQVLMVYAFFAVAVLVVVPLIGAARSGRSKGRAVVGIAAMAVAGIAAISMAKTGPGNDYLKMIRSGPVEALVEYRRATDTGEPRTAFGVELDNSSLAGLAASVSLIYVHYLVAPFPWQIDLGIDVYASAEAMLRLILLVAAVFAVSAARDNRRVMVVLVLIYLSMTLLWAIGTTNYGQAIRHHVLTNWILVLLGAPVLIDWLKLCLQAPWNRLNDRRDPGD